MSGTPISPVELLWAWNREGWKYRVRQGWNGPDLRGKQRYVDQLNLEMRLIEEKGFESYFLLVSDTIRFAKRVGIAVGPGRGSSAASLVCFLNRITEPDPLAFPLCDFSRFIDPTREDLPDIDIDFDDERRHEVRQYLEKRWGSAYVGNIGTFTKFKGKSSLAAVQSVFRAEIPRGPIEELKGMIVERSGGDSRADAALMDTIDMFEGARAIFEKYPKIQLAVDVEGDYKSMSTHAAGVVVATEPLTNLTALYTREVKGRTIAAVAVDKYDAEKLNLMKIDLLGLKTMGMLAQALKFSGMTLEDLYRLPIDDPETIAAFNRNDVIGVFQFEGRATRLVGRDLKPDDFLELVDVNALSRPGPLFSGTTADYIKVKHGTESPAKVHPIIDAISEPTKGQIIYQEQILHALSQFGGLPIKKVHDIRRIISKKLGEAAFNSSFEAFAEGAERLHGAPRELSTEVWSRVVTSASYAFVYSHSLSYTLIAYWCMWMKVHHPTAFYASQLRKIKEEKWPKLIRDAEDHGLTVLGVTPGKSKTTWEPYPKSRTIVAGWLQLKGVGLVTARAIETLDAEIPIRKADDLLRVKGIGPKTLEKFRAQMESEDPFGLLKVQLSLDAVRKAIEERDIPLRRPTVNSDQILDAPGGKSLIWVGMVKLKEYKDIFEDERARTGDDMDVIRARIKRPDLATSCVLHAYDDAGEDVYVRINRYAYPKFKKGLEDLKEDEHVIYVTANKSKGGFGASIYADSLVLIDPTDDDDEAEEEEESDD